MKILVIGQCSLHWGRMEFGNIGNFYIIEPFFRQLHKEFPSAIIKTTFQMSQEFCERERVEVLPMDLYYGFSKDIELARKELAIVYGFLSSQKLSETTPYINLVREMDLVIDFSGDIWGENADFLGNDRFFVGLVKDRVAQILAKKTVMIAGSPGPFVANENLAFAKEVFTNFDLVTNREAMSLSLLNKEGFDISKTHSLACPAFLFTPAPVKSVQGFNQTDKIISKKRGSIGFLICGWNFIEGPFDKWPRPDNDYDVFVKFIEEFSHNYDVDIYLMSHSNGFQLPPAEFKLEHGRDFPIMLQLREILNKRGKARNVFLLEDVYDAWETKAILGQFDMVISGRVHAAVGAMSQSVPTVILDYGHEPKAHKLGGFAESAGQHKYLAYPDKLDDIYTKASSAWENREMIKRNLDCILPVVKEKAKLNFSLLKNLF